MMGNQHMMALNHPNLTVSPSYIAHTTSYPGPYAVYENCAQNAQLENVHDPNIASNYYNTSGNCAFNKLTDAKKYCANKATCTGITKVITNEDIWLPVTGGIPTFGGVTMNGTPNIFYHKI